MGSGGGMRPAPGGVSAVQQGIDGVLSSIASQLANNNIYTFPNGLLDSLKLL